MAAESMATSPFGVIARAVREGAVSGLAVAGPAAVGLAAGDVDVAALAGLGGALALLVDERGTLRTRLRAGVLAAFGVAGGFAVGILAAAPWPLAAVVALVACAVASRALLLPGPGRGLALLPLLGLAAGVAAAPLGDPAPEIAAVAAGAAFGALLGLVRAPLLGSPPVIGPLTADLAATAAVFEAVGGSEDAWRRARAVAGEAAGEALLVTEAAGLEARQLAATGRLRGCAASLRLLDGSAGAADARRTAAVLRALGGDPSTALPALDTTDSARATRQALDELVDDLRRGPRAVPPSRLLRPFLVVLLRAPWRGSLAARHGLRLGLALAAAIAVGGALGLRWTGWVLVAIALVATPRTGATVQRGRERAVGVLAGALLALGTLAVAPARDGVLLAVAAAGGIAVAALRPRGFAYQAAPVAMLALAAAGVAAGAVDPTPVEAGSALLAVAVGVGAALVVNRIAVPEWSTRQLHDAVADALDALAGLADGGGWAVVAVRLGDVAEACAARDAEPAVQQAQGAWGDDALGALRRTADAIEAARALGAPIGEAAQELRALSSWLRGDLEAAPPGAAVPTEGDLLDAELAALRVAVEQGVRAATR